MSPGKTSDVHQPQEPADLVEQLVHSFEDEFRTAWLESEGREDQAGKPPDLLTKTAEKKAPSSDSAQSAVQTLEPPSNDVHILSPVVQEAPVSKTRVRSAGPLIEKRALVMAWIAGAALLVFLLAMVFVARRHRAIHATSHGAASYLPGAAHDAAPPSPGSDSLKEARPSTSASSASSSAPSPVSSSESEQSAVRPGSSLSVVKSIPTELNPEPMRPLKPSEVGSEVSAPRSPPLLSEALRPAAIPIAGPPGPPPPSVSFIAPLISPPDFVLDHTLKAHSSWVTSVAFSSNGQRLASGSWDQTLKFWDVTTGQELGAVDKGVKEVEALAFSSDGRWLATADSQRTVTLRDAATGRDMLPLAGKKQSSVPGTEWEYSIAFSPDGRWLASGVDDKTVRVWDTSTGEVVRDLVGISRPVMYVAFSPDGRLLASGDGDKNIEIWEASSGRIVRRLTGHKGLVNAVAFSPDGRSIASASSDKTVKIWDVATGQELRTLNGHRDLVTSLAFSADGHWLASGSWDKTIRIWNLETGSPVRILSGHDPVYTVAFDSSGRWLASGSEAGAVNLWRVDQTGQTGPQH